MMNTEYQLDALEDWYDFRLENLEQRFFHGTITERQYNSLKRDLRARRDEARAKILG